MRYNFLCSFFLQLNHDLDDKGGDDKLLIPDLDEGGDDEQLIPEDKKEDDAEYKINGDISKDIPQQPKTDSPATS